MSEKAVKNIVIWLCMMLSCVILVAGFVKTWPTYQKIRSLKIQDEDLIREIAAKQDEIKALREKQKRFAEDPVFVEMIAREQKRIFPGEIVFLFED